jgi:hypothetical protein
MAFVNLRADGIADTPPGDSLLLACSTRKIRRGPSIDVKSRNSRQKQTNFAKNEKAYELLFTQNHRGA